MKHILLLFFIIGINTVSVSQIWSELSEVTEHYGNDYEILESDNLDLYIKYVKEFKHGKRWTMIGFTFLESGKKICSYVHIIEAKSRSNYWITYLNEKEYVKTGDLKWRDYENNIEFSVEVFETGVSIIKKIFLKD